MAFNSINYFLFVAVVLLMYCVCRDSIRWLFLLGASLVFYAALKAPYLIPVLLLVVIISYFTGIWIDRSKNQSHRLALLWGGIVANILVLVILKYVPFLTKNINFIMNLIAPRFSIPVAQAIISIGVSYYVFQAISYLIDIYLEIEKPEHHFGYFALYLSFFPKLMQGPIERSGDLLPQLRQSYAFSYDNLRSGVLLFAWGLFKKAVIADHLSLMVNTVFDNVYLYKGFPLLLATYYYALQIFFDFSGYTDMALGTAKLFNINLTQNFNNPYFARSIADFWRRWHISFSRWILDYIFKPLQMSIRNWGNWGAACALLVTFGISGLWHGASWGYIVWGLLHGIFMAASIFYRPVQLYIHNLLKINKKSAVYKLWQIIFTFNIVSFAFVFFRANTLNDAKYIIKNIPYSIIQLAKTALTDISNVNLDVSLGHGMPIVIVLFMAIAVVTTIENYSYEKFISIVLLKPLYIRYAYYFIMIYSIIILSSYSNISFIYNRF